MSKTALITGASRGIGRECARLFAQAGYNVAAIYNKSEEAALSLKAETGCGIYKCDVSDCKAAHETVEAVFRHFGSIDVLINNAAIAQQALFSDITEEMWDNMFDTNVKSVYNFTHGVLPHMIHEKYGRIINISSMWGQVGASCEAAYSASKGAILALTKALAKELGPSGIRVNAVAPGVILTDMVAHVDPAVLEALREETPLERNGRPEDVAKAMVYLAGAEFITGQILPVNGGFVIT